MIFALRSPGLDPVSVVFCEPSNSDSVQNIEWLDGPKQRNFGILGCLV